MHREERALYAFKLGAKLFFAGVNHDLRLGTRGVVHDFHEAVQFALINIACVDLVNLPIILKEDAVYVLIFVFAGHGAESPRVGSEDSWG